MVNIADIPIALVSYKAWFTMEVIDKGPLPNLGLEQFIKSVMTKLVYRALGRKSVATKKIGSIGTFQSERLQSVSAKKNEPRLHLGGRYNSAEAIKKTQFVDPETPESLYKKYFLHDLMFFSDPDEASYIAGTIGRDEESDAASGIYYLKLGRDRGLVKSINFSRTTNPLWEAVKIRNESDRFRLVPEVYDANVDMYGNAIFEPGMMVIIDPSLPAMGSVLSDNSAALQLGLGGLYQVNNMIMTVSENGFYTQLITSLSSPIGPGAKQIQTSPEPVAQTLESISKLSEDEREQKLKDLASGTKEKTADIPEGKTALDAPPGGSPSKPAKE